MANDFDDFDTEIQCDELIPSWYEDDDAPRAAVCTTEWVWNQDYAHGQWEKLVQKGWERIV